MGAKKIIYDDESVRVIYSPGVTGYVIITFGDMISLANGNRFFADSVVEAKKISAIGFMPKNANWYPMESMRRAIESILPYISLFDIRVLYGGSMGGYAALKYSNALAASHVISLCPQWSIDPAECEGKNSGYSALFMPHMKNMGIISTDISGQVIVCHDNLYQTDEFHVGKIKEIYPQVVSIIMRHAGHHVTTILAGKENLTFLINASLDADFQKIKNLTAACVKNSIYRIRSLTAKLAIRHPVCILKKLTAKNENECRNVGLYDELMLSILIGLKNKSYNDDFNILIKNVLNDSYFDGNKKLLFSLLNTSMEITNKSFIYTTHDTVVVFDAMAKKIKHVSPNELKDRRFIPCKMVGCEINFGFAIGFDDEIVLKINAAGDSHLDLKSSNDFTIFDLVEVGCTKNKLFSLVTKQGLFACAEPNGNLVVNRVTRNKWEEFYLK